MIQPAPRKWAHIWIIGGPATCRNAHRDFLAVRTESRLLPRIGVKCGRPHEILARKMPARSAMAARRVERNAARAHLEAVLVAEVAAVWHEPRRDSIEERREIPAPRRGASCSQQTDAGVEANQMQQRCGWERLACPRTRRSDRRPQRARAPRSQRGWPTWPQPRLPS